MPTPALLAPLRTPVLSRVITLLVSEIPTLGVKVAVQVTPPSMLLTLLRVPLLTVRSLLSNPFTASLKVMVTVEVSPILNDESATTMVAVGTLVSTW